HISTVKHGGESVPVLSEGMEREGDEEVLLRQETRQPERGGFLLVSSVAAKLVIGSSVQPSWCHANDGNDAIVMLPCNPECRSSPFYLNNDL
uniref:Uncharacterized protein n=1 Tax=Poecilia mexicana TaxID=48701 RepID=A0A3B3Z4E8_9TELE